MAGQELEVSDICLSEQAVSPSQLQSWLVTSFLEDGHVWKVEVGSGRASTCGWGHSSIHSTSLFSFPTESKVDTCSKKKAAEDWE